MKQNKKKLQLKDGTDRNDILPIHVAPIINCNFMTSDHAMKFIMSHIKGVFLCVHTFLINNDLTLLFLIDEHVIFTKVCMIHRYIT